jgi:hypothetical protein
MAFERPVNLLLSIVEQFGELSDDGSKKFLRIKDIIQNPKGQMFGDYNNASCEFVLYIDYTKGKI